jgi:hypothetical protein
MSALRSQRMRRRRSRATRQTSSRPPSGRYPGQCSPSSDLIAVEAVVIASVREQRVGFATRPSDAVMDRRDRVEQRQELGDVVAVAAGQQDASGVPCPSVMRWCFEPARPRSTGDGLVRSTTSSPTDTALRSRPVDRRQPQRRHPAPASARRGPACP